MKEIISKTTGFIDSTRKILPMYKYGTGFHNVDLYDFEIPP